MNDPVCRRSVVSHTQSVFISAVSKHPFSAKKKPGGPPGTILVVQSIGVPSQDFAEDV